MEIEYANELFQAIEYQVESEQKRLNAFREECQKKGKGEILVMHSQRSFIAVGLAHYTSKVSEVLEKGFLGLAIAKLTSEIEILEELLKEGKDKE